MKNDLYNAPGAGRNRQSLIYRNGTFGSRPAVPTRFAELEHAAKRVMSPRAWAYVAGGAGSGETMRSNRAAFSRWSIVPRMAHGVTERNLGVEILRSKLPVPLLLAPIGAGSLVARHSDIAIAQAAAELGVPYVFSNQSSDSMEACAAEMGTAAKWMQLYWSTDERLVDSMIARAEMIGAEALVVTLDTTSLGWRPEDLNIGSLPFARGEGIAQYTSDPYFQKLVRERIADAQAGKSPSGAQPQKAKTPITAGAIRTLIAMSRKHPGRFFANLRSIVPRASVEAFLDIYSNPGLSWEHLATLRARTSLPIVLKGILHPDDARRAFDLGVEAIVVSNHGGRQVDRSIAALDALIDVREAVGSEACVLFDSGIRSGADMFLAIALGANAVLLGRPYMYGLALAGKTGVQEVIANLIAEFDLTMALAGARAVDQIDTSFVQANRSG